jgi:hypothetical protein
MKAFQGAWRNVFLCFFISHIPITICIDGQGLFSQYYPQVLRDLVAWYCDVFGDVLMRYPDSPPWFQALVCAELVLQLPFFFAAVQMIRQTENHPSDEYPSWFRTACLIYGSHVTTTLVPIIATFWASTNMTTLQICMTTAVYSPYWMVPLALLYFAAAEDFPSAATKVGVDGGESKIKNNNKEL